MSLQVLIVGSYSKAFYTFTDMLRERGFETRGASTVGDARPVLQEGGTALVLCAAELLDGTYRDILEIAGSKPTPVPVMVFAGMDDSRERQEAISLGAVDCVPRPLSVEESAAIVQKAATFISSPRPQAAISANHLTRGSTTLPK
jgi:DNA-binding NtrC family response regulator